ncbi:hypothetical protein CBR_g55222 [Chara braunii]|uniref:DNA methylase N-4/N-6 domain-containing protein n=1 Tax=Chara braunii TaxID=69332 RepID=A0A388MCY8_CHABU|nr:hypothetical protein CBR_g55222 [Chara braunii]|eukprot:GBG92342.1 hypothetical protein CBR_g55222 [Chara braunii]
MLPSVRSVFAKVCNAGQELLTWCKPNVTNPGGPRLVSATEFCVLGYYNVTGHREMAHYNFSPTDPCHNFQLFDIVTRKFVHLSDNLVLCLYQKPYTLYSWLVRKFSSLDATVLDGFSDSGTGAIACVLADRNCLVVELDKRYAQGIWMRLLTDIEETLRREKSREGKGKGKEHQQDADIEVSGDDEPVTHEKTTENQESVPGCLAPGQSTVEASVSREATTVAQQQGTDVALPADQQQRANVPSTAEKVMAAAVQHGVKREDLGAAWKRRKLPALQDEREKGELSHQPAVTVETGEVTRLSADPEREDVTQSQDSSRATDNTRGCKRKMGGEEVVSSQGGVVVGLRSRAR